MDPSLVSKRDEMYLDLLWNNKLFPLKHSSFFLGLACSFAFRLLMAFSMTSLKSLMVGGEMRGEFWLCSGWKLIVAYDLEERIGGGG